MMRSNRNVWLSLGASVLFAAAVGCSHNEPAAQQPSSSPPFESNVPSSNTNQEPYRETLPRPTSDGTMGGMYGPERSDDNHSTDMNTNAGSNSSSGSNSDSNSSSGSNSHSNSNRSTPRSTSANPTNQNIDPDRTPGSWHPQNQDSTPR